MVLVTNKRKTFTGEHKDRKKEGEGGEGRSN